MSRNYVASILTAAVLAVMAPAAFGAGTTLFQDNFDSYPDQASLLANYNGPGSAGSTGPASSYFNLGVSPSGDDTTQAVQYANMPASGTGVPDLDHVFNSEGIKPSDDTPIVFSYDFFWDGTGNKRTSAGIRVQVPSGSNNGIIEMGYYNSAYNPITSAAGSGFAVRTTNFVNSSSLPETTSGLNGWRLLTGTDSSNNPVLASTLATAGTWMTFKATIYGGSVDYTLDLNRDGTIDAEYVATIAGLDLSDAVFTDVRLGGPSGLSSTGGGAYFDNVSIVTAPIVTKITGDTNGDGVVDLTDLNNVLNNFGVMASGNPGDDNMDGTVDLTDLNNVLNNFGNHTPAPAALSAVPEPASLSLLGLGAAGLLVRRRRNA